MIVRNFGAVTLFLLAGCVAAHVPEPTAELAPPGADLGRLRRGRSLYVNRCSGCHRLHDVERFTDVEWGRAVQDMIHEAKVKLTEAENGDLLDYLTTFNTK